MTVILRLNTADQQKDYAKIDGRLQIHHVPSVDNLSSLSLADAHDAAEFCFGSQANVIRPELWQEITVETYSRNYFREFT